VAVVAALAVLGGAFLWFRDSSLVAVRDVKVSGVSGADAPAIRSALITAARNMTTLDVDMGQLRTAVKPYPDVKRLAVSAQFPHGMRIRVIEQMPVAVVIEAGRTIPVANDGTLLRGVTPTGSLPEIMLRVPPGGQRLTGAPLAEVRLVAAAPSPLLAKIGDVNDGAAHGLEVQLRDGPSIYFGDPARLSAKWNAAAAVLADSGSEAPSYVDVTDPSRPAAGAGTDARASASATSTAPTTTSN
jgi:cell division protein FtsQ